MTEKSERKPFVTRLIASIFIWLVIALIFGVVGFFVWFLPEKSEYEMLGENLPPFSGLTLTEGKFVDMGHYVSRRTQYLKPNIEFQVEGKTFQFRTVVGYAQNSFPFEQGHKVEVLYTTAQPENAWLKWEYERLIDNYKGVTVSNIGEKIRTGYTYFAFGLFGTTGLILLINLFVPILRWLK